MNLEPWYHEGLRFACTGCGGCCTGAPGYVWVSKEEIRVLAEAGGVTVEEFEASFVRREGNRKSLLEHANGDCVFFDSAAHRCLIYVLRPRQCRTFPFWASIVRTPATWLETCSVCPGCEQGPLIPFDEIQARLQVIRI